MADDSFKHGKAQVICGMDSITEEPRFIEVDSAGSLSISGEVTSPTFSSLSTWKTVSVDTTATGTELVAANTSRRLLIVVNNGATDAYVGFGSVASGASASASGGLLLKAGGGALVLDGPIVTSQVKAITASSSTILFVGEGG